MKVLHQRVLHQMMMCACITAAFHYKPKPSDLAKTSRWLMHEATWGILSTISTDSAMLGAPFGNPQSVADGYYMKGPSYGTNSSGIPYFYVSEMDVSQIDAQSNNIVSLTMSEAQLPGGCQATDPESPLCVRLTITGKLVEVTEEGESEWAKQALFQRHPVMKGWPTDHDWKVKKIVPSHIFVLDMFGGAKPISVEEYLDAHL